MTILVLSCPGIGEPTSATDNEVTGLLRGVTEHLPRDKFVCEQFDWQNKYGPVPDWDGRAYSRNLAEAQRELIARVDDEERVVLLGYSGGAHLVSLVAERLGAHPSFLGSATVANPIRRVNDSDAPFWGVAGQHHPFEQPHLDLANPADVICACPPHSPIRGFSDVSKHFSLADPVSWGRSLSTEIVRGQMQGSLRSANALDWWQTIGLARGYLIDGQHTAWYLPRLEEFAGRIIETFGT